MKVPTKQELEGLQRLAQIVKSSSTYRKLTNEADIILIFLAAQEFGIPLMSAINGGLNLLDGKVELQAHMQTYKIRQAGHSLSVKYGADWCEVTGKRRDSGDKHAEVFTMQDAEKAELSERDAWRKYRMPMLYARALSRVCDILFPDVIGGVTYAIGEIDHNRELSPSEAKDLEEDMKSISQVVEEDIALEEDPTPDRYHTTAHIPEESYDDQIDMMIDTLYNLFPEDREGFQAFVHHTAEKMKKPLNEIFCMLYKYKEAVPQRYKAWCEAQAM